MLSARTVKNFKTALAIVPVLAAAFLAPSEVQAAAGGIQNCTAGSTCTIGEFLYDDSSAPINNATCTITSRYPDDTSLYAASAMDLPTQSDGWYSKTFTAPATTGLYRTSVTCTVSGDNLSIDKSFEVVTAPATDPNAIAAAVWSYSTRTVTSFGSLIADIWANATRTLTGATLDSGTLATKVDTDAISAKVDAIATASGTTTNNYTTNNSTTNNTTNNSTTDVTNMAASVDSIKNITQETRLLLEQVVNKPIIQNVLEDTTPGVTQKLQDTRAIANQLYVNNQFLTAQSATLASTWSTTSGKDLLASINGIAAVIGNQGDSSSTNSMFGQSNWIKDSWSWDEGSQVADQLTSAGKIISDLQEGLANYQKSPALLAEAKQLVKTSLALEKIVGTTGDKAPETTLFAKIQSTNDLATNLNEKSSEVDNVLAAFTKSKDAASAYVQIADLQNQVIALNKIPDASSAVVRANPALPNSLTNALLGLKGIINSNIKLLSLGSGKTLVNVWLEVGSIIFKTVATNPSNLVAQKVDVKYYLPAEIKQGDIIKTDAGLTVQYDSEKDQLFVAGTFTLSPGQTRTFSVETRDIWSFSNDQLDSLRAQADTLSKPLEKTAYFAQGVTLKSDIDANLDQITTLQSTAVTPEDKIKAYRQSVILKGSVDTKLAAMKDLVTQAGASGSLFGFVGGAQTIAVWGLIIVIAAGFIFMATYMRVLTSRAKAKVAAEAEKPPKTHKGGIHPVQFAAVVIATSILSAGTTGYVVNRVVTKNFEEKISVLGTQTSAPAATPQPAASLPANLGTGGQYLVIISTTPTGFLRVRETPGGREVAEVKSGDKLPFLDEQDGWYKVTLEDGTVGWVSMKYSNKE